MGYFVERKMGDSNTLTVTVPDFKGLPLIGTIEVP